MSNVSDSDYLEATPAQEENSTHPDMDLLKAMFADTAETYDSMVGIATLGLDRWWKRRLMRVIPNHHEYRRILDLGCGTGISTLKIAEYFPDAEVVGIDLTQSYLDVAAEKVQKRNLRNISLVQLPVERMSELPGKFDLILGSFIPKLVDVDLLASGSAARISPGGAIVLHDFIVPDYRILRLGFHIHWHLVKSFMRLRRGWYETSQNLFRIIWESDWQNKLHQALVNNGFTDFYSETQPLQVARIVRAIHRS
jgi:demethylmenaquinone methyltransferase/2-methoxy-6-polyprenyl-1,4-benzoquinol methylase